MKIRIINVGGIAKDYLFSEASATARNILVHLEYKIKDASGIKSRPNPRCERLRYTISILNDLRKGYESVERDILK